jgi:hypothetical protein
MIYALHWPAPLVPLGISFLAVLGTACLSFHFRQKNSSLYMIIPILTLGLLFLWAIFLTLALNLIFDWWYRIWMFLVPSFLVGIFIGVAINYSINIWLPIKFHRNAPSLTILIGCWFFMFAAIWWLEIIFAIAALPID